MSEKQTRCPKCLTLYKVSMTQLTVAQGMVCCPKCDLNFNALSNLFSNDEPVNVSSTQSSLLASTNVQYNEHNLLDIFNRRIENSNIDLLTYLNNLNYFQHDAVNNFPQLNLAEINKEAVYTSGNSVRHSWTYYFIWGILNTLLLLIFIFQILWFNPKMMHSSPVLSSLFNHACSVVSCKKLEEKYTFLTINKVKVTAIERDKTQFSGILLNYHDSSLELPRLKLTLKNKYENKEIILMPQDYLVKSLSGIQRIPKDSPYKFEFSINQSRKSFDDYTLEIVQP
ncbi:DUF3426 domain-containing protein [Acinetobacter ihumii]|uniref:DUF3426 domain-containing protein n=1 Tax=Acinetobacter ihumii TaxID=2483802 RepID=UPI001030F125|nr:DUF3426 domain-containing protein [Acinetobacter ihumii]